VASTDDTRVTGWVRAEEIEPEEAGGGRGDGIGLCARGCIGASPASHEGEYGGKALVAKGTRIHAGPGGGAWATLSRDADLEVFHARGDAWVRLRETPGIRDDPDCDGNAHAFVPVERVTFAPGVRLERRGAAVEPIAGRPDRAR
jgi:hypothetical protein